MKETQQSPLMLLYLIVFFTILIFNSTFTILPLYLIQQGGTAFLAGVQTTLFFAFSISLRFYFGPLADRIGHKVPLMVGIGCFTLSSFLFIFSHHVWVIGLVRLIQALGLSAFLASSMSAVADRAPQGRVGAVMGTYRLISTLSLLTGPALALQVIRFSDYGTWFAICTGTGILSLMLLLMVPFPQKTHEVQASAPGGMWKAMQCPAYRLVFIGIALTALAYGALLSFASLHISAVTSIANPGLYFVFFGFSSLTFTFLSGYLSDRWGRARVAWPALVLLGLGLGLLFYLEQGQMTILLMSSCLAGVGFNGGLSALSAWLVDLADTNQRATVLSVQESIIDFSIGAIAFLFGSLTFSTDFSMAFLLTGLIITSIGVLFSMKQFLPSARK